MKPSGWSCNNSQHKNNCFWCNKSEGTVWPRSAYPSERNLVIYTIWWNNLYYKETTFVCNNLQLKSEIGSCELTSLLRVICFHSLTSASSVCQYHAFWTLTKQIWYSSRPLRHKKSAVGCSCFISHSFWGNNCRSILLSNSFGQWSN